MNELALSVLLLVSEAYGANWLLEDGKPSIQGAFESYGWRVETASVSGRAGPCPWAAGRGFRPRATDYRVAELRDPGSWDAVVVLPGRGVGELSRDPAALAFLRRAEAEGLVIGAFCRGVGLLAAADLVRGRRVAGHADDRAALEAAGAIYQGYADLAGKSDAPPPVVDGRIVTGMRSNYYRSATCEAIRDAVLARRR